MKRLVDGTNEMTIVTILTANIIEISYTRWLVRKQGVYELLTAEILADRVFRRYFTRKPSA